MNIYIIINSGLTPNDQEEMPKLSKENKLKEADYMKYWFMRGARSKEFRDIKAFPKNFFKRNLKVYCDLLLQWEAGALN